MNKEQLINEYWGLFQWIPIDSELTDSIVAIIQNTLNHIDKYVLEYKELHNQISEYNKLIKEQSFQFNKQLFESEQANNFPLIEKKVFEMLNKSGYSKSEREDELNLYYNKVKQIEFSSDMSNPEYRFHSVKLKNRTRHLSFQLFYGHLTTNVTKIFHQDQIDEYGKWQSDSIEWFILNRLIKQGKISWKDWYDYDISKVVVSKHLSKTNSIQNNGINPSTN